MIYNFFSFLPLFLAFYSIIFFSLAYDKFSLKNNFGFDIINFINLQIFSFISLIFPIPIDFKLQTEDQFIENFQNLIKIFPFFIINSYLCVTSLIFFGIIYYIYSTNRTFGIKLDNIQKLYYFLRKITIFLSLGLIFQSFFLFDDIISKMNIFRFAFFSTDKLKELYFVKEIQTSKIKFRDLFLNNISLGMIFFLFLSFFFFIFSIIFFVLFIIEKNKSNSNSKKNIVLFVDKKNTKKSFNNTDFEIINKSHLNNSNKKVKIKKDFEENNNSLKNNIDNDEDENEDEDEDEDV